MNKVDVKDYEFVNEIVDFIFVKQNNKNYCFNNIPKDFNGIRYHIKHLDVFYIKENTIKLLFISNNNLINYLYFEDISYFDDNINFFKNKKIEINKENVVTNELINHYNNFKTFFVLKFDFTKKLVKDQIDNRYKVIPLLKHLVNDYIKIHSDNKYSNNKSIVCIKNNEMVGYLDFNDEDILEIVSCSDNKEIYYNTIKQLLLNFLVLSNRKEIITRTNDLNVYKTLIDFGFIKIEENIRLEF